VKLWVKILLALVFGVIIGGVLNQDFPQLFQSIDQNLFDPIGSIFLNLINMIIVPLVLSSMTVGITSIHDPQKLGRVGIKVILIYLFTTAIAIGIGLSVATIFQPGEGLELSGGPTDLLIKDAPTIKEIILSIVPKNPIASLVSENVLQIIVFSIFLGLSINFAGDKGRPLRDFMESLAETMYKLTSIIMEFSPIGVFAIMASVTGKFGWSVLKPLSHFLFTYYFACGIHIFFVFCGLLWFFAKLNPWHFFRGMGDAIMMAFSTCSSSATLPVSMHCVQRNLGVSKNLTSFILPLGSTVNMNGSAIYQGMAAIFVSQVYGIHLDWSALLTIVLTATLSAIGAAGIPGTGFLMLSAVLTAAGLPTGGLALLLGIDRLREMVSTVLNILGDAVVAVVVAKQEGELDERQYNHEKLVEMESSEI
jgi:Na+/H+-dicarboxylate symporter